MLKVKEYLPIGSIVYIKDALKKVMIIGIMQTSVDQEGKEKEFDYLGVCYPEGFLSVNTMCMFNQEHILEVVFRGYENGERTEFLDNMDQNIKTLLEIQKRRQKENGEKQ